MTTVKSFKIGLELAAWNKLIDYSQYDHIVDRK